MINKLSESNLKTDLIKSIYDLQVCFLLKTFNN